MADEGPGKRHRKGISLLELAEMFPDEGAAVKWFERVMWNGKRCCGHCGSLRTVESSHAKMPYWCSDCRSYFSVRTGTGMERSKVPVRKWAYAIYLDVTSLKGVAAVKLHRDIRVAYKTAWFMQQRIRGAFGAEGPAVLSGSVEVDEMSNAKRKELEGTGRGPMGKTVVVGARDRDTGQVAAQVIDSTDRETLQGFVDDHAGSDAALPIDDATAYKGSGRKHATVKHSAAGCVRSLEGATVDTTGGVESIRSMRARRAAVPARQGRAARVPQPPSGWADYDPATVWLKALARRGFPSSKVGRWEWRATCPHCSGVDRFRILRGPDGYISGSTKTVHMKPLDARCLDGCDAEAVARILYPFQRRSRVT
ncbi:MAG: IS1595 family transposase [Gemmatimonadota bacterium]|nr:IS1595 family transposase [Gemmatimonadota bacterium]MDE2872911.1 IS1595 family transposase [Gemmatimonadota bacterium]